MLTEIRARFLALKGLRRSEEPLASVEAVADTVEACLSLLRANCECHEVPWRGKGEKDYDVFAPVESESVFSRGIRRTLFIPEPEDFRDRWGAYAEQLVRCEGTGLLKGIDKEEINRLFYTAVVGFGAAVDVFGTGDRGGPGTFFECAVGPALALLTGRSEKSYIDVPLPAEPEKKVRVPVDLSFPGDTDDEVTLVVPTKISTRERISQAFVHQAILSRWEGRKFRSVLCIANENNMAGGRSVNDAHLKDTLVPKTIVQYQMFIAELSGMYYLDPPAPYMDLKTPQLFPSIREFSTLLTEDLPVLLSVA